MGFVETMAIEVSRATVPDRPILQVPFPRFTYAEVLDRYRLRQARPAVRDGARRPGAGPDRCRWPAGHGLRGVRRCARRRAAGSRRSSRPAWRGPPGARSTSSSKPPGGSGRAGLVHVAVEDGGARSPIAKFVGDDRLERIAERAGANPGDLVLIVADAAETTADVLGRLRVRLGERLGLADPDVLAYCWVHRFPMYQWDADHGRWDATHNPFSGVLPEDLDLLTTTSGDLSSPAPDDPAGRARAMQYDLALNGWELGGGSVRIHRRDLLERSFALQGQTPRRDAGQVRGRPRRVRVRRPAARRDRPRDRPLGDDPQPPDEHPRGHGLPEDPVGHAT